MTSNNVQFMKGDFALVPRAEYERLVKAAREAAEDDADRRTLIEAQRALAEGRDVLLPEAVALRIMAGESAARVVREWREKGQSEVAAAAGISQSYLAGIEGGNRKGTAEVLKKLALALAVPTDLLIDD